MLARLLLNPILDDEALTRHLGDAEASVLVEWLVEQAEHLGAVLAEDQAEHGVRRLGRRGRAIARFVHLWSQPACRGAATQLAGAEGFEWPLPTGEVDPWELMQDIVDWERQKIENV